MGEGLKSGDVVLTQVQFTDSLDIKTRPAVVLFEDLDNVVIAGVTSNLGMQGIPLTINEGAVRDSVIKLNYLFTISRIMIKKVLFHLSKDKKKLIFNELLNKLST